MKKKLFLMSIPAVLLLASCGAHSQAVKANIRATAKYYYEYESFTVRVLDNNASGTWANSLYEFDHGKFKISAEGAEDQFYQLQKKGNAKSYFESETATKFVKAGDEWTKEEINIPAELNKFKDGAESLFKITNEAALLEWKKDENDLYSTHASYGEYTVDMKVTFNADKLVDKFYVDGSSSSGSLSLELGFSEYGTTVVTLPEVAE